MKRFVLLFVSLIISTISICQVKNPEKNLSSNSHFILSKSSIATEIMYNKRFPKKLEINLNDQKIKNQLKSGFSFYEKELDYDFGLSDTVTIDLEQTDTLKIRMRVITGTSVAGIGAMLMDTTQTDFELIGEDYLLAGLISVGFGMYYIYAVDFYLIAHDLPELGLYEHDLLTVAFKSETSLTACAPAERKMYINVLPDEYEKVNICQGEVYTLKNKDYFQSQVIYDTLSTSPELNMDVIKLTVNEVDTLREEITICKGNNYNGITESGEFQDILISSNGCDSVIVTEISVEQQLQTPTITKDGDILTANLDGWYQWYINGEIITGATTNSIEVQQVGDYHAILTNEEGCSSEGSNSINVLTTGFVNLKANTGNIRIYPNPVKNKIYIEELPEKMNIMIIDNQGKMVYKNEILDNEKMINIAELTPGTYFIKLIGKSKTIDFQFIKY